MKSILLILFVTSTLMAQESSKNQAHLLLDKVRKDLNAMSADFEQYEIDVNQRVSEKLSGYMWLNAPDQFKWEYVNPAPQLIIANGQKVWIYDEDLEQVIIKQQDSGQNPIYVLLNKEITEKNYVISHWQQDVKDDIDWVSLVPKVASDEIKQVWLGIQNNNLKILKLKNQLDNVVIFEFKNVIRNPDLADDFFTFAPPDGIDVIQDSVEF